MRSNGCTRYGIVGFSWGGLAAEIAAKSGHFSAAVSVHGWAHNIKTYQEVRGNILYITAKDDQFFSNADQEEIIAASGNVNRFDGFCHNFVVRGDFTNDAVKGAADEAMADV